MYEQLEALVHVQVNIDVNFIFLIIKKTPFLLSLGHKMIGIRNIRVDYERELLLTSIILLYSLFYNSCVHTKRVLLHTRKGISLSFFKL